MVKETRKLQDYTRRRYECANLHRFTTHEVVVVDAKSRKADPKHLIAAIKEAAKVHAEQEPKRKR
jgi:hypothetical protein